MKLLVHIGHGKTGSSSIQGALLSGEAQLTAQRIKYLGLMLERAVTQGRKPWQVGIGSNTFFNQTPVPKAIQDLAETLDGELRTLQGAGYDTAIWSNEWILERPQRVIPALQTLAASGVEIEIQVYLRRHDKWAISAYTQWGLRHKTYTGPIQSFDTWAGAKPVAFGKFYNLLEPWLNAFPGRLRVMNFDAAGDVTEHFLRINGITGIEAVTENVSPPPTVVAGHAVFNSRQRREMPPHEFDHVLNLIKRTDQMQSVLPTLDKLMPQPAALEKFVQDRADDVDKINALLLESGEPPLSFEGDPKEARHPASWEMDQFMLKMIYALFEEVGALRNQVNALKAAGTTAEKG